MEGYYFIEKSGRGDRYVASRGEAVAGNVDTHSEAKIAHLMKGFSMSYDMEGGSHFCRRLTVVGHTRTVTPKDSTKKPFDVFVIDKVVAFQSPYIKSVDLEKKTFTVAAEGIKVQRSVQVFRKRADIETYSDTFEMALGKKEYSLLSDRHVFEHPEMENLTGKSYEEWMKDAEDFYGHKAYDASVYISDYTPNGVKFGYSAYMKLNGKRVEGYFVAVPERLWVDENSRIRFQISREKIQTHTSLVIEQDCIENDSYHSNLTSKLKGGDFDFGWLSAKTESQEEFVSSEKEYSYMGAKTLVRNFSTKSKVRVEFEGNAYYVEHTGNSDVRREYILVSSKEEIEAVLKKAMFNPNNH